MKKTDIIFSVLFATAIVLPACGDEASGDTTSTTTSADDSEEGEGEAGETETSASASASASDTTTTDTTDTDMTTTTSDSGFVNADASGPSCGEECDIWNPGDCGEGQKCTSVACEIGSNSWDSNVCRDIQGSAAVGDECMYTDGSGVSGNDTCDEGAMCWNADQDTGLGTCIAFCVGSVDSPSCQAGSTCAISNNGTLPICLASCDPLAQDCEASNELCIPNPGIEGYICTLDASGDMAPYGTPCNFINVCNQGLLCIDPAGVPEPECASAQGCCSPMCSISSGDPCPGNGQSCEPVFDPQPPGYEDVGVCTIAM